MDSEESPEKHLADDTVDDNTAASDAESSHAAGGVDAGSSDAGEEGFDGDEDIDDSDDIEVEQPFRADDPLAPAFDLELGEPISAENEREAKGLPWQSRIKSAKEFLSTELLYRYDILEQEVRNKLAGTYRLDLRGDNGGSWTLTLGDELLIENVPSDADITLAMTHSDFVHLVNGDLNPQLAILAKKIRIGGDLKKALIFQGLLIPNGEQ